MVLPGNGTYKVRLLSSLPLQSGFETRIMHGIASSDGSLEAGGPANLVQVTRLDGKWLILISMIIPVQWNHFIFWFVVTTVGRYRLRFNHPGRDDGGLPSNPSAQVSILDRSRSHQGPKTVIITDINQLYIRYATLNADHQRVDSDVSFVVIWNE